MQRAGIGEPFPTPATSKVFAGLRSVEKRKAT
jgi:hypothetical protein